ncbi:MAG: alpha/beta hydrolase, partial [Rectinema sp.]|nr:alpha/beta hydrolase [Rectinema sp.]
LVHVLIPKVQICARSILYLHGGSYLFTFTRQHWNFLARLAERTGSIIIAPDYPLAPGHVWSDAYRFLFSLHEALCRFISFGNIILMGDSAGGGLALGYAMALRDRGLPMPATLILLSPWLDVTLDNPQIADMQNTDPMLNAEALRKAGRAWAGHSNPRRPEISPLYGDVHGLPHVSLFIGTHDLLLPDCRKFKNICTVRGVPLDYYEYEHMMHVWMMLPVDESKEALGQIEGLVMTQAPCIDPDSIRAFAGEVIR